MQESLFSHVTAGVLGGAVGTALLSKGMKASQKLPERLRPTPTRKDPGEFMIEKVEELRGQPFSRGARDALVQGMHWAYGMTAGLLLGLTTSRRPPRTLATALGAGAAMGTAVWAVGYAGWLPATKLTPPLTRQGARHIAASLLTHVAFGVVAAAPILLLSRSAMAEPAWRRALRRLFR